jgi:hypothetical protein
MIPWMTTAQIKRVVNETCESIAVSVSDPCLKEEPAGLPLKISVFP